MPAELDTAHPDPNFLFTPGAYFLAGTDTDVGKTFVGCLLAQEASRRGLKVGAYKPVASGFPTAAGSDGQRLWEATGKLATFEDVSPQRFTAPLAPQQAAEAEGKQIDEDLLLSGYQNMRERCELLITEGAGGLFSPVSPNFCNIHLARKWNLPIVLVASWKLGMIHQVLSCLHSASAFQVSIRCIVLSANTASDQLSLLENGKFLAHSIAKFYGGHFPHIYGVRHNSPAWDPIPFIN